MTTPNDARPSAPSDDADRMGAPSDDADRMGAPSDDADRLGALNGDADRVGAPRGDADRVGALSGDAERVGALHDDAVRVLNAWRATTEEGDLARKRALELLADGPAAMTRAHRVGHVTASALVVAPDGRVLLCLHGRLGKWMQLGGHCEPGDETLAAAALREATEECGIPGLRLDPDPIDVDVHEVRCGAAAGTPATPSVHYDVRFLVRSPEGATEQISDESSALGWFSPDALPSPLASATARQIPPALSRLPGTP